MNAADELTRLRKMRAHLIERQAELEKDRARWERQDSAGFLIEHYAEIQERNFLNIVLAEAGAPKPASSATPRLILPRR